jgi:hypothetical protein
MAPLGQRPGLRHRLRVIAMRECVESNANTLCTKHRGIESQPEKQNERFVVRKKTRSPNHSFFSASFHCCPKVYSRPPVFTRLRVSWSTTLWKLRNRCSILRRRVRRLAIRIINQNCYPPCMPDEPERAKAPKAGKRKGEPQRIPVINVLGDRERNPQLRSKLLRGIKRKAGEIGKPELALPVLK